MEKAEIEKNEYQKLRKTLLFLALHLLLGL